MVRARGETCGVCGNPELRSGEDAASEVGGGYSVTLRCTNALLAEDHAEGIGLVRDYYITRDEAREVGLS